MSDEKSEQTSDPFALWRQWYEANEKAWGRAAAEGSDTEAFAQMQGKMLETFLAFQKSARDAATAQLQSLNVPTRDDIARLGELIVGLEEKVDQIGDRLERLEDRLGPPAPRPARARGGPR
ncbi:MAG: hypothetical protein ACRDF0_03410 [Candidatus Limnocylindria bacterium]